MANLLRRGSRGEAVRDLGRRLATLGHDPGPDSPGFFGPATETAVRAFQHERGLRVDGVVGTETWSAIVESGFALGDRILYLRRPALRGDDVTDLQRRLNQLGFDAGREDGIFAGDTRRALVAFQRDAGVAADGICGTMTVASLRRVGTLADGSVAALREREARRLGPHDLVERRVFIAATPGLAALGELVTRRLLDLGARVVLDSSGADDSWVATAANEYAADLFLGLRPGDALGCHCAYFASGRFRSEAGYAIALAIHEELTPVLGVDATVCGRAYAVLRETRMPAVVCEVVPDGDVDAMRQLVVNGGAASRAIARGIRRAVEEPAATGA